MSRIHYVKEIGGQWHLRSTITGHYSQSCILRRSQSLEDAIMEASDLIQCSPDEIMRPQQFVTLDPPASPSTDNMAIMHDAGLDEFHGESIADDPADWDMVDTSIERDDYDPFDPHHDTDCLDRRDYMSGY